jgi:hypothetical protein
MAFWCPNFPGRFWFNIPQFDQKHASKFQPKKTKQLSTQSPGHSVVSFFSNEIAVAWNLLLFNKYKFVTIMKIQIFTIPTLFRCYLKWHNIWIKSRCKRNEIKTWTGLLLLIWFIEFRKNSSSLTLFLSIERLNSKQFTSLTTIWHEISMKNMHDLNVLRERRGSFT